MGLQFNTAVSQQNWNAVSTNTQTSGTSAGPRGLVFGDSIQSSGGTAIPFSYMQEIGMPILPPGLISNILLLPQMFSNLGKNFIKETKENRDLNTTPQYSSVYQKSFSGTLEQAVKQNGLSEKEANMLTFAEMTGTPIPNNPKLNQILSDIQQKVVSQMNATFGSDNELAKDNWSAVTKESKQEFEKSLGRAFEGAFQGALDKAAKEQGLTKEQVAQLEYAHNNPDAPVSPEIKQLLEQINGAALSQIGPQWGIPDGYVPHVDNTSFNATVEYNYGEAFKDVLADTNLSELANKLGISEEALKGIVNYIHHQGSEGLDPQKLGLANTSQLQDVLQALQQVETSAGKQIAASTGLPDGVFPGKGEGSLEDMLKGRVLQQFEYDLKNQDPPLNEQQIAQVLLAVQNPLDPKISPETKSLVDQVFSQAVSEVRTEYQVPVAWSPQSSMLDGLNNRSTEMKMANAGLQFVTDSLNLAAKYLDPTNPNNAELLNVLKLVASSLASLKEAIAEMEVRNAEIQSKISEARNQANIYKIKIQNEKLEEALKKARKMKPLMAFMKIFGPIFKALMAIVMMFFVPVGPMLAASMFQDIATDGKQNFLTDMFKKIMETLPRPANIIVSAAVVLAMTTCACVPNPMIFMQLFFENSHILQEVAKTCGASDMTAEMVNMISQMSVEIILMIILTVLTGGAAGAAFMAQVSSAVTQITIKTLQVVLSTLQKMIKALDAIGGVAGKVAEVLKKFAQSVVKRIDNLTKILDNLGESTKILGQIKNTEKALESTQKGTQEFQKLTQELETLNKSLMQIDKEIADLGGSAFENIRKTATHLTTVSQVATAGVQATVSFMQGDLEKFKSEMDAQIEELQNLVKILTDTLQKLMSGMDSMVSWTTDIGKQQSHMWNDMSQAMTSIANANQS